MKNDLQKESLKQLLLAQKVQLLEKMKQDSEAEKKEKIEKNKNNETAEMVNAFVP